MNQNLQPRFLTKAVIGVAVAHPMFVATVTAAPKDQELPNIVVVLCDDLGYGDLGCFGHKVINTPNLDKLAADGIKLTNFYSSAAVSSPSRAGLLTGRNPNRAGFYDFIPGPKKSEDCRDIVHLQEHEITIPALLKSAGYSTCLSGKWHCSSHFNSDKQPKPDHFGFDHWFATHNNAAPNHRNPNNFVRNGEPVGQLVGYSCEVVVNEALGWLDSREDDNPFYLHVTFHEPHENVASPKHLVEKYMPMAQNENEAMFFANVENMDKHLGRLLDYIEERFGDNTLVVFSADNGPETLNRYSRAIHSYGSTGGLKGRKLWTNEGGVHVSGIMNWFGRDTFQGESDAVVSALDYLPSFCELAGVELPNRELDGESMLSLFENGEFERTTPLLWVFYNAENEQVVSMREGDWKILCNLEDGGETLPKIYNIYSGNYDLVKNAKMTNFSLYNLREDRNETTDLSTTDKKQFKIMQKRLKEEYDNLVAGSHIWVRK
ncbi:MAG: sulfatase-like hydrolase/transferase [Rikenellaceae bacterium]